MKIDLDDIYRYDENFVLRVPPLLSAAIYWSIHHVFLLILAAASNSGEVFGLALDYGGSVLFLLSDLPGGLVLFARLNRTPDAGRTIRWIWHHGLLLLIVGLGAGTAVTLKLYYRDVIGFENPGFFMVAANCCVVLYLLCSKQARNVFADFPKQQQEQN